MSHRTRFGVGGRQGESECCRQVGAGIRVVVGGRGLTSEAEQEVE